MTITVSCPSCDTSFPVDPAKVPPEGVRAQCSNCPEIFDVDRPAEAMPEAPPEAESTPEATEV
ncbi:MAG: zinc-ribbon domain-containing protein, partial [Vicinamibacteria bacterium]